MTLSLAIICKDEVELVRGILEKYTKYFDCVDIAVDERVDDFKALIKDYPTLNVYEYKWVNDFADKRNWLRDRIKADYYFRIDTDDTILNPENIRPLFDKVVKEDISIAYCFYNYSEDDYGTINSAHYREAIVRNDDNLFWNKPIHENVLPKSRKNFHIYIDEKHDIIIKHTADDEHALKSALRNIKILLEEYNEKKEETDPRTLAYLGRVLMGVKDFEKAKFFLEKHIEKSGWDEDRYFSWCQLSEINKQQGNFEQAISCAFEALQEFPDYPDAYLKIHDIYFEKAQWYKAIEWGLMGLEKKLPTTFMLIDPSNYTWRPQLSLAFCYFNLGQFEKARMLFDIAKQQVPTFSVIVQNDKLFNMAVEHRRFMDRLVWMVKFYEEYDKAQIPALLKSVPKDLDQNEVVIKLRHMHLPHKVWSDKSIVIYCGSTTEEWFDLSTEKGIGGSEEAAIHMSRELVKLGYEVTVYNNCGENEGKFHGVEYLNWVRLNPKDEFNIMISWRSNIFEYDITAKKRIIWMHDLPQMTLDDETEKTFDYLVTLSHYHKDMIPNCIPEEKLYVSTNGINPADFKGLESIKKEPRRIIYASSYNRGLETILNIWKEIRTEVPDATLHIYYGWNVYDKFVKEGYIKTNAFKQRLLPLLKQEGVFEYGRINHRDLAEAYARASVLAYPCNYEGEINCIALTKAIASGCIPVTNRYAVMAERNPYEDLAVEDVLYKDTLIDVLKATDKESKLVDKEQYIQANSWESVAKAWVKDIL